MQPIKQRILITGNSGSGKSTLARKLATEYNLTHLDLDSIAWLPAEGGAPPVRSPLKDSLKKIDKFIESNAGWVIEGCYADMLDYSAQYATELIYLDLSIEECIAHARSRPWEPEKYASKQAQDANLPMLLDWIRAYETRRDTFSKTAHQQLFDAFMGKKQKLSKNQ